MLIQPFKRVIQRFANHSSVSTSTSRGNPSKTTLSVCSGQKYSEQGCSGGCTSYIFLSMLSTLCYMLSTYSVHPLFFKDCTTDSKMIAIEQQIIHITCELRGVMLNVLQQRRMFIFGISVAKYLMTDSHPFINDSNICQFQIS